MLPDSDLMETPSLDLVCDQLGYRVEVEVEVEHSESSHFLSRLQVQPLEPWLDQFYEAKMTRDGWALGNCPLEQKLQVAPGSNFPQSRPFKKKWFFVIRFGFRS